LTTCSRADAGAWLNYPFLTRKERDIETGLDYFLARYYSSTQGRFTGVDPYDINLERQYKPEPKEAESLFREYIGNPQQWNHYTYALNNPLAYLDPTGEAVELAGTEEERKKQLEALRAVVGKQAGAYLYENKITDKDGNTKYFVGIYTNGPDGKGPAFEKINEAAGEVGAIIRDAPIQRLGVVPEGTVLNDDYGNVKVIGSINHGLSPGYTGEYGGVTTSYILDPSTNPGRLPGSHMSDGKPSWPTTGELMGHEIGHGRARVTRDPNSNAASLRLENKVRTQVNHKTSIRTVH
jgi:RHS repeat-associated protein